MSLRFQPSLSALALVVALATFCLGAVKADEEFANDWDAELNFECPAGQFISSVYSVHNNVKEDRRWRFGCQQPPYGAFRTACTWTADYVNNWDEAVSFMCPAHYAIAGVQSVNSNAHEDRRMKFKCCKPYGYKTLGCELTPFLNDFDAELNFTMPNNKILAGWFSLHSNKYEDRRHKMLSCIYLL
ncbi:hypothetical protein EGW08_012802 [Elysia chlorotica]|uniref:Dermatopontin n=1 Tax=Elysia chlorotica TaxID=188477 RepID=A0A433TCV9_ELYCH|nr:hypothetical protein EGW08_012802 [Elysia chlorotica]